MKNSKQKISFIILLLLPVFLTAACSDADPGPSLMPRSYSTEMIDIPTGSGQYASAPLIAKLGELSLNSLYLGGWDETGVLYSQCSGSRWPASSNTIDGTDTNSWILAMAAGDGRDDSTTRLYVSGDNLREYSWDDTSSDYTMETVAGFLVGRIGIGAGRNDGVNRIYAVRRSTATLYEFTWVEAADPSESKFEVTSTWTGISSHGCAFVGNGRGDGKQRVYVWSGRLYELTWTGSDWSELEMDQNIYERYYINIGSIGDEAPAVYVSTKDEGLFEYVWNAGTETYEIDTISAATGGTAIGAGRNDGVSRLYAARGTKSTYTGSVIVEISDEN